VSGAHGNKVNPPIPLKAKIIKVTQRQLAVSEST